jgi:hypothetical protein
MSDKITLQTRAKRTRKQVVTDTVHELWDLDNQALALEEENENLGRFRYATEKLKRLLISYNNKKDKFISQLIQWGLCSDRDGLTSDEADNPIFSDVESGKLWIIGNGEWC